MEGFKCEFCSNVFSKKYNLNMHKKTAKYCISMRNKTSSPEYKCQTCDRSFVRKFTLDRHVESCSGKHSISLQQIIDEKDEEICSLKMENEDAQRKITETKDQLTLKLKRASSKIRELEETITSLNLQLAEKNGMLKIKQKPNIINNQYINPKLLTINCDTIPPLTIENVKREVLDGKYTYDKFIRGENGLVDFISTLISEEDQKNYVCTDTARNKFHRLIETREWENDNGATFLNKILDQLKEPATKYYQQIIDMTVSPTDDRELGDILMKKTKPIAMGITCPKSKDRSALFNRIRTEVRKLASV